jgi:MoxR-like ATPase
MKELFERVRAAVGEVVIGQDAAIEGIVIALSARGHVLLEGVPGVAKTLLANATSRALALDFTRAQFTPDMLPSDLTGTMTLRGGELVFRPGPVFTNFLLADEVNRTPPKTQAALLEAMQEAQVTIEGEPRPLPDPFLVVATQNPIEYEGTYPLPEAQLDRFMLKLDVAYPDEASEVEIVTAEHHGVDPADLDRVRATVGPEDIAAAREAVDATIVKPELAQYVVGLVRRTRELPSVSLGASPRAAVHLLVAAKAAARLDGRDFAVPDDVIRMATPVLGHRLLLSPEAELERFRVADVIENAISAVPVPR